MSRQGADTRPDIAKIFHALGDPTRRIMVERLGEGPPNGGPMSVSRLAEPFGMTLTAVSQHLAILETAGLVTTEKIGRTRTVQIGRSGFAAIELWLKDRRTPWERRLDALGDLLDEDQ